MCDDLVLFSILNYPVMVKGGAYLTWRKKHLITNNTLLAVVTLPPDLFYPVGVHTLGVFIKKGIPHPNRQNVLWVRALNDGFLKSKGKRLPSNRVENDLDSVKATLRAFLNDPTMNVENIQMFQKAR